MSGVEHEPHEADAHARRLGHHGEDTDQHHELSARHFGEPHHGGHPTRHARPRTGSPPRGRRHPRLRAQRRLGRSLSSIESSDSSASDLSSDEFSSSSLSSDTVKTGGRGDELRMKASLREPLEIRRELEEKDARPVDYLYSGIKKSFRGEKDGSVIAPHTTVQLAAIFAAEVMGTAFLTFLGCMSLIFGPGKYFKENEPLAASLIFGVTIMIIVQIIGHTSASHINPAVSLCALLLGKLRVVTFFVYFVAQMIGSILGVGILKVMTPQNAWNSTGGLKGCCQACLTIPHRSLNNGQAFLVEFMITSILIFTVCSVWDKRNGIDPAAPIKFGLAITGLALVAGAWTGASMNPARSFGPALWELNFERHWVYWVAPLSGSIFATLIYTFVFERDYWLSAGTGDVPLTDIKSGREKSEPEF